MRRRILNRLVVLLLGSLMLAAGCESEPELDTSRDPASDPLGDIVLVLGLRALVIDRLFRRRVEGRMGDAHDFDALDTCVVA